jgi:acetyl-CoA/propionyl-CoA carboxylase biotin carboxyl carrier protein
MIAKLVVHDTDRESARRRMLRALDEFVIEGPPTLLGFHRALLREPCFVQGGTCHGVVESDALARKAEELSQSLSHERTRVAASSDGRTRARSVAVELDGRSYDVRLHLPEPPWAELARRRRQRAAGRGAGTSGAVASPMQGTVLAVEVAEGEGVSAGQVICVVEAMKMENEITAHREGVVRGLAVVPGQAIGSGDVICVLDGA